MVCLVTGGDGDEERREAMTFRKGSTVVGKQELGNEGAWARVRKTSQEAIEVTWANDGVLPGRTGVVSDREDGSHVFPTVLCH